MNDAYALSAVREYAGQHHVPPPALARWLAMDVAGALAILSLAQQLRPRTGQLLSILEMLADIALREGSNAAQILARPELRAIIGGSGSRPGRAGTLISKLKEIRYPQLSRTRVRLEAALAALNLPRGVTVVLPVDLSSDELSIRLTVRRSEELDAQLAALQAKVDSLKKIVAALGGLDEL